MSKDDEDKQMTSADWDKLAEVAAMAFRGLCDSNEAKSMYRLIIKCQVRADALREGRVVP